jgi:hypothetical protein
MAQAQDRPPLKAGEGLALALPNGEIQLHGDAGRMAPMGSLAKLLWLRLEGEAWMARSLSFRCTGTWKGFPCWKRDGHGPVDLPRALDESCNLAFLAWAEESLGQDRIRFGEDLARTRLEAVFQPFWGDRIRTGTALPALNPAWVGDGELLPTSPEAFLRWLQAAPQASLRLQARRLLSMSGTSNTQGWWLKTGTAPTQVRGVTGAWVAGGDGSRLAVLYLPRGRGKAEGLDRFCQLLGLPRQGLP